MLPQVEHCQLIIDINIDNLQIFIVFFRMGYQSLFGSSAREGQTGEWLTGGWFVVVMSLKSLLSVVHLMA